MNRSSIALSNLRAVVILIVLAFHSVLAYLASLPATAYPFDSPPYRWQAFPIVDSQRWFGFDLFCAWQDVSLMSADVLPLGPVRAVKPCAQGKLEVPVGPPAADWPAVRAGRRFPDAARLLSRLSHDRRRSEPRCLLAALARAAVLAVRAAVVPVAASGVQHSGGRAASLRSRMGRSVLVRLVAFAGGNPVRFFVVLVALSALAYVPLLLAYSPWDMDEHRPVLVSAQPAAALSRLFLCRLRGRGLWPRPRPACQRWRSGAALGGVACRSLRRLPALGRADLHDDGRLEQRAPGR